MMLRGRMGAKKDGGTLLSGHPPAPDAPALSSATPASGASDPDETALQSGEAGRAPGPAWSWVSRTDSATFGETDRFVEKEPIGHGGMSTVVRAFDKDLRRDVAIKVLSPGRSASDAEVERFATEARITGQLEHP